MIPNSTIKVVRYWAGRYSQMGVPFLDLVQVGLEEVVYRQREFCPNRGVMFNSYIKKWVRGAMADYAYRNKYVVRGPIMGSNNRKTPKQYLGTVEITKELTSPYRSPEELSIQEEQINKLAEAIENLSEREYDILYQRKVLEEPLRKLAKKYRISIERVRQIEYNVSKALKHFCQELKIICTQ